MAYFIGKIFYQRFRQLRSHQHVHFQLVIYFSAQCQSFMQCWLRNFLMQSWHKLCNVDAVKLNRFSENQPVLQSTITACSDTKNGQCDFIYPHSLISAWINCVFILDGGFSSLASLEGKPNAQNTKCVIAKRTLNK